ncbi:MAG: efflux RND transporter periplasmic adaptor subunit [Gemmatimonadetes bacterium]|nr:efflux RND transporter periplasmic adaptor subunit [Gemmatimonadota bacterium]MBT5059358.1 efflux RND transporter periplasmic adaptor subunit [Gemmatimonadota bacterium]MBT5141520.1 efflux RND transporter periplasmic adaptor subunit [Gemmatimonadota bacterium]MBT5588798.1 efflux RND transporter periplasmic adaptor subunit [Gemmatimonadota bacterium]MBT5965113.1 efflux RND transporter periplasmic adaptor subunit [Gemmatimonadota bacterium]
MTQTSTPPPFGGGRKLGWKPKLLIFLLLAGSIGGLSWVALKKEEPTETFPVLALKRGNLVDKLGDTGTIELVRTVEVKSTIAGEIRKLPVEAGDAVVEGQLLAVVEPDPNQSLQLEQKRAAVERGRLSVAELERDLDRQRALFERKMLSASEFENAEMRLTQGHNDLRLARLELEILETKANLSQDERLQKLQLDEVRVLSPISGIVVRRGVEIGEVVASGLNAFSGGTLLFEIGDPSQMIVRGDIAEIDIGKLETGQEVDIVVDAYPDTTFAGRVRWIAPVGAQKPGSPIVTFDTEINIIDLEPRLRQGMSCDIDIIFSRRDSVTYLPVEAVLEVFDEVEDDDDEDAGKGRRGRFIAFRVEPDTTSSADSEADAEGDDSDGDDLDKDDDAVQAPADPDPVELSRFVEIDLEIGLRTNTRIEILGGLADSSLVAADPQQISDELEELAEEESEDTEDEDD